MTDQRDEHPYSKFEDQEIDRRLDAYLPGSLVFPERITDDEAANYGYPQTYGFPWQNGPRGEHGEHENGLLPSDLIYLARKRIEYFNSPAYEDGKHRSRENSLAVTALEEAFHWCVARTFGRVKRGVSGLRQP